MEGVGARCMESFQHRCITDAVTQNHFQVERPGTSIRFCIRIHSNRLPEQEQVQVL